MTIDPDLHADLLSLAATWREQATHVKMNPASSAACKRLVACADDLDAALVEAQGQVHFFEERSYDTTHCACGLRFPCMLHDEKEPDPVATTPEPAAFTPWDAKPLLDNVVSAIPVASISFAHAALMLEREFKLSIDLAYMAVAFLVSERQYDVFRGVLVLPAMQAPRRDVRDL